MIQRQPNVVLIVADELMAAALSCYGGTQIDTPGLERLSAEGVTFEAAYCNAPVCTPSRYSMLSGRYPWGMRVYHNQSRTPAQFESIAGMLTRRGYDTVAIGKMHFKGAEQRWGYRSRPYGDFGGLSHQPDPLSSAPRLSFIAEAGPGDIREERMHDAIVGRLAGEYLDAVDRDRPFLLHLGFNFPHYPLRPPKRLFDRYFPGRADLPRIGSAPAREHPWMRERRAVYRDLIGEGTFTEAQVRRARAAYYACVAMVDEQLVRIFEVLDRRGLTDQTAIVFTADHGELLGEYGTWEKNCFYEPSVRVPLLMRLPGAQPGRRVPDIVELVDLLPTLRQLVHRATGTGGGAGGAGSDAGDLDGQSLLPLLGFPGRRDKDYAISELAPTHVDGLARMVRRDRWKYIAYDTHPPSLFDLRADPDQLDDLGLMADPPRPEPRLVELARTDFDRVRRESAAADLAVQPTYADMTPNQFHLDDGSLADAEDFYAIDSWVAPPGSRPAVRRVRPRPA